MDGGRETSHAHRHPIEYCSRPDSRSRSIHWDQGVPLVASLALGWRVLLGGFLLHRIKSKL